MQIVVCDDVSGRRKRPQRAADRTWNGHDYCQRPRDHEMVEWKLLDVIEEANRDYDKRLKIREQGD